MWEGRDGYVVRLSQPVWDTDKQSTELYGVKRS